MRDLHIISLTRKRRKACTMSRRFRYNIEAIHRSIKVECPHCHFVLGAADILAVNSKTLRCKFCDGDFVPLGNAKSANATEVRKSGRGNREE